MPFFSIIIPAYNRYNSLQRAVESVLSQTFKDFELIIVDDGSEDDTPMLESRYGNTLIYIRQENQGVSSARNKGIAGSNSPYIAFLDSDDQWLPEKLQSQYLFIKEHPDIPLNQTEEIWIRNGRRVNAMDKHAKSDGDIFLRSLELCMISPSSVVLNRTLFETYGVFDENLPVCEDYDLWLRMTAYEKTGLIKNKFLIKYSDSEPQLSKSYWGIDRFRVYSIIKLMKSDSNKLRQEYFEKARETAIMKCSILLNGANKRHKEEFAGKINKVINHLVSGSYSKIDSSFLVEK